MSWRAVHRHQLKPSPSFARETRCINCSLLIPSQSPKHSVDQAPTPIINLLQSWIFPTPLLSECVLCSECLILLQNAANSSEGRLSLPAIGHRSVCFPCGKSTLRIRKYPVIQDRPETHFLAKYVPLHLIPRFERVCGSCRQAARRALKRVNQNNSNGPGLFEKKRPGSGYEDDPGTLSRSTTEVSTNGNEIKVFCPNCNTEVSHTAEGIQQDQTKILIAKVYHYFEQEYKELKMIYGDLDLAPLSNFYQRTTLATGVSEAMLMQILKQEERRNEERQREPPPKERAARKRRRQTTYSSSEEYSSDGNVEDIEQPSPPEETLVVKIEPPEYSFVEPEIFVPAAIKLEPSDSDVSIEEPEIFIPAVKVEPSDDDTNKKQTDPIGLEPVTHEDDTAQRTPASETSPHTKRKAKKTPKLRDETLVLQQTQVECSSSAASRSKRRATEESPLPGEVEIKLEEGFS